MPDDVAPPSSPPGTRPDDPFAGTRTPPRPQDRRALIVKTARALHERLQSTPPVTYFGAFSLVAAPYPVRYGLRDATWWPMPFLHIRNRVFVLQVETEAGLKTLLFSPSDFVRAEMTPFFRRLGALGGPFNGLLRRTIATRYRTVPEVLASIGLAPSQVDYLSYDHLHTQDLRGWLGDGTTPAFFPNAKLLVHAQEWASASGLIAPQLDWYCPGGVSGVPADRIVTFDHSLWLGRSVLLMHTPGHTEGNHSLVVRTPTGILVSSENGIGADSYAPLQSRIPGVAKWARTTGMDVVLNGNTLEGGLDQYLSMVQEREVAGENPSAPGFFNVFSSSELSGHWAFPGISPTFAFGDRVEGTLRAA